MMTAESLVIEKQGSTAQLRLNRPAAGNAIDLSMAEALRDAARDCADDPQVKCVTLTGAGRYFCVGGDVGMFATSGDDLPNLLQQLTNALHGALAIFAGMRKPLLIVVNGPAAGAGMSLALAGDVVLASKSANFTAAYTALGLTPDGGLTWWLPRLVGIRLAQDLILTNRRMTAAEALAVGLVTRIIDGDALVQEAEDTAAKLSATAGLAVGASRSLLMQSLSNALEHHLSIEANAIVRAAQTSDGKEGISAFLAKREPLFTGN
jgi:2-(1,2-epoxy-1,2-dihydrophenyl)acetyl-CoA isomerase